MTLSARLVVAALAPASRGRPRACHLGRWRACAEGLRAARRTHPVPGGRPLHARESDARQDALLRSAPERRAGANAEAEAGRVGDIAATEAARSTEEIGAHPRSGRPPRRGPAEAPAAVRRLLHGLEVVL